MNAHAPDTITALATPPGTAGLAVVRISGPSALDVARRVCDHPGLQAPVASHRALVTVLRMPEGDDVDTVVVTPMVAPGSYTGEDVVEISCHGGEVVAARALEACLAAGARAAGPGEFTRRAFLNGRMSLDQAEAVADLIHARDALAARAALAQLRGGLKEGLDEVERPLRGLLARLEGGLEFDDDTVAGPDGDEITAAVDAALAHIDVLLGDRAAARLVRDGVQTVVAGAPNAGKSSLFNALLGERRALVDHEAGTTRDVVSASLELDGITFVLHDTAGLRDDPERVEAAGIASARRELERADLVLAVEPLDGLASTPVPDVPGATVLRVGSKADVGSADGRFDDRIDTSSVTGAGLDDLRAAMVAAVRVERLHEVARTGRALSQRHADRLADAAEELRALRESAGAGAPDEVIATLLGAALSRLGEVTGRVFTEHLLDEVFQRFCVGK